MPANPLTDPNWAPKLADSVERIVTQVRDKTTKPVLTILRALIFGVVIGVSAVLALALAVIALVRVVTMLFDLAVAHAAAVWITYLTLGGLFSILGLLLLRMRFPKEGNS
jgi:hypothetical protein